jgi:predicted ATP-grasp superfamily ATP-dependent carboligase
MVLLTARHREALASCFDFPSNTVELVERLISKLEMSRIAQEHGVPVPRTLLPRNERELLELEAEFRYPVMLKPCFGSGATGRTDQFMVIARDRSELLAEYRARENPASPNMMLQEYIPGGDDQIYIFNGYFDSQSRCLAGFTGRKLRQHPIHRGCASMGEQCANEAVAEHMVRFLGAVGYRGIVDAGLRYDARDGQYKLLDVNPRVGQAFRLFLSLDGTDVVRCMYRDLTGQPVGSPLVQREGRRWVIEDYDLVSFSAYRREGSLSLGQWLASFRGVEEGAWWCWRDPAPFAVTAARMASRAVRYLVKQLRVAEPPAGSGGRPSVSDGKLPL